MMKRDWIKRAFRTFYQAAAAGAVVAVEEVWRQGEFNIEAGVFVAVAALAAGISAVQNSMENRRREGPMEG